MKNGPKMEATGPKVRTNWKIYTSDTFRKAFSSGKGQAKSSKPGPKPERTPSSNVPASDESNLLASGLNKVKNSSKIIGKSIVSKMAQFDVSKIRCIDKISRRRDQDSERFSTESCRNAPSSLSDSGPTDSVRSQPIVPRQPIIIDLKSDRSCSSSEEYEEAEPVFNPEYYHTHSLDTPDSNQPLVQFHSDNPHYQDTEQNPCLLYNWIRVWKNGRITKTPKYHQRRRSRFFEIDGRVRTSDIFRKSIAVNARRPFARDEEQINYVDDSESNSDPTVKSEESDNDDDDRSEENIDDVISNEDGFFVDGDEKDLYCRYSDSEKSTESVQTTAEQRKAMWRFSLNEDPPYAINYFSSSGAMKPELDSFLQGFSVEFESFQ